MFHPGWNLMAETSISESEAPAGNRFTGASESAAPLPSMPVATAGRGLAVGILAAVAVTSALDWAQSFVISLLLGIPVACTLNPLVACLRRFRAPCVPGA
jgi:hypothetical protein